MKPARLPRSLDDLRGLRAARWIRESTAGQVDRFGPDAQRDQQDRAIERFGLRDTGLSWVVAHSGRTVGSTGSFAEMLAAAGERYDVLVVGYVSRFARDLRTAVNARHDLHAAGGAILFADERVLSSDEDAWETWAREAVEAEAYSRRLGKRIREGYAAKFRREADQGGNAPLGFRRTGPAHTLEVDPETIGQVVAIFERYAAGTVSIRQLADETGLMIGHLAALLKNPVYNGWVRRGEQRTAAAWRAAPPVSDELWGRVEQLRGRRARARGRAQKAAPPDPLRGLLFCPCGATVRAWGVDRRGTKRRAHPLDRRCDEWGDQVSYPATVWTDPLEEQLAGLRLDDATVARVVAAFTAPATPAIPIDRGRLERQRRELALNHAAGRLSDEAYLGAAARLRELADAAPAPAGRYDAERAITWMRDFAETWRAKMDNRQRAELMATVYERIEVRGPTFASIELTDAAYRNGLALALPERVRVAMVSPEGAGRTFATRWVRVPILGRADWLRAARRSA